MSKLLMLQLTKTIWKYIGLNMYKTTMTMNLMSVLAFFLMALIPGSGIMVLVLEETNITNLANAFESSGPYMQLIVKVILTRLSIDKMRELLHLMELKFWPIDYFGEAVKQQQMETYLFIKFCFKTYIYTIYLCSILMSLKAFFSEERRYPLMVYNIVDIQNTPYYITMYSIQVFGFYYACGNFLAIDGLYALFIINLLCQIIMLKHAFSTLKIDEIKTQEDADTCYEKLKMYVDHHNMILDFIRKLDALYSAKMFFQFIGNTASICVGVYITAAAGISDMATVFRASSVLFAFFFQLTVYCIGGTLLTEACLSLAESVYESGWEGPYRRRFRFATNRIMQQSQKTLILKAGKIFDVNLSSLTGVVQLSVSLYTLMNTVNNKIDEN